MTREEIDREIRALCEAGNYEEATRCILKEYGPELMGWVLSVVKEEASAEDIGQLFSVALWRGLSGFRWEGSLRTWAYRIARRELIRFQQAKARRDEPLAPSSELRQLVQEITSIHSALHRKQVADRLIALRRLLPEEAQTLLILRVDRQMPFSDIAQVLEIEAENARQKFKRAKDKLKEMAQAEGLIP